MVKKKVFSRNSGHTILVSREGRTIATAIKARQFNYMQGHAVCIVICGVHTIARLHGQFTHT